MTAAHSTKGRTPRKLHSERMLTLDALRGVAVLLVMFSHLTIDAFPGFAAWEASRMNFGTMGVCIFFCVSG